MVYGNDDGPVYSMLNGKPTPSTAVFTAFPAINSFGRSLSGVGTSVATLTKDPNATAGANDKRVFFTVSEPCICIWQSSVVDPSPIFRDVDFPGYFYLVKNSTIVQFTSFPYPVARTDGGNPEYAGNISYNNNYYVGNSQLISGHGYRHILSGAARYRAIAWELFEAGTYGIDINDEGNNSVEGTFSLVPLSAPAILRFRASINGDGRQNAADRRSSYWTQPTAKQVVFYSRNNSTGIDSFGFSLAVETTLTITRAGSPNYAGILSNNIPIPGATAYLQKDGWYQYELQIPSTNTATSGSVVLQPGTYQYRGIPYNEQVILTLENTPVVLPVIAISVQPSNQTSSNGAATFSVTSSVTLGATLSYQWQKSTDSGSTWTAISGATSASLTLTNLASRDNSSQYRVVVSANVGATSVTSNAATLTVPASGKAFSNVSVLGGGGEVSGAGTDAITLTRTSNNLQCSVLFTIPSGTLTITKPNRANVYGYLRSPTSMGIADQQQEKDGSYYLGNFPSQDVPANSTVSQNTTSGFSGGWEGSIVVGESVTLTIR
jgi:hypothetical protein